jgi:hypothetical protein
MADSYTFTAYRPLDFNFEGSRVQMGRGDARTFTDVCQFLRFVDAASASVPPAQQGVNDQTNEGLATLREQCSGGGGAAGDPPQSSPVDVPPGPPPGADTPPPGGEDTTETLLAPDPDTVGETESPDRPPGSSDGRPLSQQVYDPENPMTEYDAQSVLEAAGVPPILLQDALQQIFQNAPPLGQPHPFFGRGDRQEGASLADPVILFSGQYSLAVTDITIPSRGFDLALTRQYRSGEIFFGPWGFNWDHNYNVFLRELADGGAAVWTGQAYEEIYGRGP